MYSPGVLFCLASLAIFFEYKIGAAVASDEENLVTTVLHDKILGARIY